jgi:diadenosine tetraphosphatase ApaH/serine/threonine PP2A family protein phosphatase
MARRTIIIGDIHGCYDELIELLEKIGLGADDQVVAVGDLIVKGEKNREVLNLFSEDRRFRAVIGNHDLALLRYWRGEAIKLKEAQEKTRAELESDRERYATYLDSLPLMIDLGTHLVVHAGVRPGVSLDAQAAEDLTELRTLGEDRTSRDGVPWYEVYDGPKIVLFGHWPAQKPRRAHQAIGLDTGCVYGYQLTAYIIETDEFVSVQARRAYDSPKRKPH